MTDVRRAAAHTVSETKQPAEVPKRSRRLLWLLVGAIVVVGAIGAGIYYYIATSPAISRSVVNEAEFSVYAPNHAPSGFHVDDDRTNLSDTMLSYVFVGQSDEREITVTVQPTPAGFDMSQLIGSGSINSTTTSNGTLYDLSAGGTSRHLLNTGDALVFLTSAQNIDTTTINQLAQSLRKLN